jgi:hypothetical protein
MAVELTLFLLVLSGFVSVCVGLGFWGNRRQRRRAEKIRAVGDELGLAYFLKGDPAWISAITWFESLSWTCSNVLYGQIEDLDVRIFDHLYATGIEGVRWQSMVSFSSSSLNGLPNFVLRPDSALHRIASVFGYKRIRFESHPGFSQAFLLRGSDEAGIRQVFDDGVLSFFEHTTGVYVDVEDDRLLFYRRGVRVEPADLRAFMDEGFKVYRLFCSSGSEVSQGDG